MEHSNDVAKRMATLGESLRQSGNYSGAIGCFTQAIAAKEDYWWAYAHRAVARGPLGDYSGALEDFEKAKGHYGKLNKAWLLAQKGELFRLWARAALVNGVLGQSRQCPKLQRELNTSTVGWETLIRKAIELFTEAEQESSGASGDGTNRNPWILAHRGAAYTMRYWIQTDMCRLTPGPSVSGSARDFESAKRDFNDAIQFNPSYGWAYAFSAILSAARCFAGDYPAEAITHDMNDALFNIGKAQMNGLDRQPSMLRAMMELSIYMGGKMRKPEDAKAAYNNGVQFAWQALQIEIEETFARYFAADGLKQLQKLSAVSQPVADAAVKRAHAALDGMTARLLAMRGGLDCLEGNQEAALEKLRQIREIGDLEALTMVSRDPAWAQLRKEECDRCQA
jgi:hypothetical protein